MEDERRGNEPSVAITRSPDSSSNITIPITHITTSTLKIIANNVNANNNNNSSSNKEQDRFLPIANVGRIMKKVLPGNGKISKDAKETVQECVSEFISFVTGEASDKCQREKRKTINGDDIIWAITTLGFDEYVDPLKSYLNKYRELEGEKLNVPKQQRLEPQQQQQPQHDQKPTFSYSTIYSPTALLPHASFVPVDQSFPLPFSPNPIQSQLPKREHVDSMGH
ncbi:nuclear transcription factor Y subunit B-3-like [Lycium barbarum]|uniref:nuclear transcription factor Y subunit B-3-like n=1 Tax=Lycium barbarum TaxID=112863 RepID=UPI00293E270E|nr:nuclear transcription factor Y subunit B-3-like [Lycium barbarum]